MRDHPRFPISPIGLRFLTSWPMNRKQGSNCSWVFFPLPLSHSWYIWNTFSSRRTSQTKHTITVGDQAFQTYLICYVKIWTHMLNAVLPQDLFCSEGYFPLSLSHKPQKTLHNFLLPLLWWCPKSITGQSDYPSLHCFFLLTSRNIHVNGRTISSKPRNSETIL